MSLPQGVRFRLTDGQRGIWYAVQGDSANPLFGLAERVDIQGPVDTGLFEAALRRVVDETEALRVSFGEDADGPYQVVAPALDWPFHLVDVSGQDDPEAAVRDWTSADQRRPVDLSAGPLFTFALFRLAEHRYVWYQRHHHIALDGLSVGMVARRVAAVYSAASAGQPCPDSGHGGLRELIEADAAYGGSEEIMRRPAVLGRAVGRPPRGAWPDRTAHPLSGRPAAAGRVHAGARRRRVDPVAGPRGRYGLADGGRRRPGAVSAPGHRPQRCRPRPPGRGPPRRRRRQRARHGVQPRAAAAVRTARGHRRRTAGPGLPADARRPAPPALPLRGAAPRRRRAGRRQAPGRPARQHHHVRLRPGLRRPPGRGAQPDHRPRRRSDRRRGQPGG